MASPMSPMKNKGDEKPGTSGHAGTGSMGGQSGTGMGERAKEAATTFGEKARESASSFGDRAKETATSFADRAKDAASSVAESAQGAASNVGQKAEDATSAMGCGLKSLGQTIRENAPHGGMVGDASSAVAQTLEKTGRYLEQEGLQGIGEDLTAMVRRNPIPALLVGVGVGFLLARATSSRS